MGQIDTIKNVFENDDIRKKFHDMLGNKAAGFIVSVINVVSNDSNLATADRNSILFAAATAAALDLPINPNLGFAYIVPYGGKAQFQMGYKGFKQLALRTGLFKDLNATDVREGELITNNRLTGEMTFEWIKDDDEREKAEIIGYVAHFSLLSGFSKTFYMTAKSVEKHAKKYSQTYKKYGTGNWKDNFEAMALKTVTKLLLSKDAPLSIEMQKAIINDQAVINDWEGEQLEYIDNEAKVSSAEEVSNEKEEKRIAKHIENAKTPLELEEAADHVFSLADGHPVKEAYLSKQKELTK